MQRKESGKPYASISAREPISTSTTNFGNVPGQVGFIDHNETVRLITNLPTRERPDLDSIVYGCVRDWDDKKWPLPPDLEQSYYKRTYGKFSNLKVYRAMCAYWNEHVHEEFQSNVDTYYEWLHRTEARMLARFQYAADRGWGIIKILLKFISLMLAMDRGVDEMPAPQKVARYLEIVSS